MKYQSTDTLEDFSFSEAVIFDVDYCSSHLKLQLANVTILSSNSNNRDIMDMRTNDLILTFEEPTFLSILEEGYKVYDANEHLIEEIPDRLLSKEEYSTLFHSLPESSIYSIEVLSNEHCVISIDSTTEQNGYRIELTYTHSIAQWNRFLKKETC